MNQKTRRGLRPGWRKKADALAAAEAARRYRQKRSAMGYVSLQAWVPKTMRAELLDIIHKHVEEKLAREVEAQSFPGGSPGSHR